MKRGVTLEDNSNNYPTHEEVRNIFNETYNVFYKKWKGISSSEQWVQLILDAREIDSKYNCDLCRRILLELIEIIEDGFKRRNGDVSKEPG